MKRLFLTSSVSEVADKVVSQIGQRGLKLVFINTAAEGEEGDKSWLQADRDALVHAGFDVTDYTVTNKTEEQVRKDLESYEVIFVSGGNTFYLLEKIQQSNSAAFFKEQVDKGVIYIGSSAGSVVAGPDTEIVKFADAVEKAPNLQGFTGLGLVDFSVLPHWGSPYFKELYLNQRLDQAYSMKNKIILLNDNQYVYVQDNWYRIEE